MPEDEQPCADPKPTAPETGSCLVVGVGASAGGLEAFQLFLERMPPNESVALVYVQHLDPGHESMLPQLLARQARMPVQVVQDETLVEPGHVYVIPPNTVLTLDGDLLRLAPRGSHPNLWRPIDTFLISLAEAQANRSVGIILSGTGADGTAGLRAIKERGGLTIAQLPESAAYDGMPRSAIAAGLADCILRPDEMPALLAAHAARFERAGETSRGTQSTVEDALGSICEIVRSRTGTDFSSYKHSTLVRRISRRMDALRLATPAEYLRRLEQDASEALHLSQEMLIGVTSFFRDPEAFQALAQSVLPGLFNGKGEGNRVRAWVVGCASGEEAYSLAMLFAEQSADAAPPKVQIFATDIDEEGLQAARRGHYSAQSCNDIPPDRLERFFTRNDGDYQVRKELRQVCVFSKHNLLHDPPFPELDLISCRNLLIYMGSRVQGKVINLFHHALRPGGALFLGTAENVAGRSELFEPIERGQRIYRRRNLAGRAPIEFPLTWTSPRDPVGVPRAPVTPPESDAALHRSVERLVLDEYTPAGMVVAEDGHIVYVFGPMARYLGPSAGEPRLNAVTLVRKSLRADLRRALQKASRTRQRVAVECGLAAEGEGPAERVNLIVRPFAEADPGRDLYTVVFQDLPGAPMEAGGTPLAAQDTTVRYLQDELRDTREQLQTTIDELEAANQELQSANEELLSMNEELQSANEELQSSKEEVQSINAELESVNRELTSKVEALDTASADLQSLFEGAQVATIFVGNEMSIKRFTPTATEVFRLRPGDVGRPVTDITVRFTNGDLAGQIGEVLRTLQRREVTVLRAEDGESFLMRILPYRTRQNLIDGVVITFGDVTELKRAQEALERLNDELEQRVTERTAALQAANRRKDDFLAMLSHELRNPLAAIASNIHLWQTQDVTDSRLASARKLAERQVAHMTHLLDDLLDTARVVRGAIEIHREPLDLAPLLREVVEGGMSRSAGRHQGVSMSLPPEPLFVDGDPNRLQQVFSNLLENAQNYTQAGGHIGLGAEVTPDEVVVRVSDDGIGITPELLPHVFDSFVQGRRGPARSPGGLGLGLTLVQHLVSLHGGSVEARSAGEGKGSEFVVRLPRGAGAPDPVTPSVEGATAPTATVKATKRILLVDDNQDAAELLALLLKAGGHDVLVAHDGPEALQGATHFRPEVVLLDIGLPEMDGYEVARQMRQNVALSGAVLVAVTGYGREEDRQRSRQAGFDYHLVKPVDMTAMNRVLRGMPSPPER